MVFVYDEKQFPGGVLGVNPWQSKIMISAFLLHKNFSRKTFDQFFINQPMQKLMEYIAMSVNYILLALNHYIALRFIHVLLTFLPFIFYYIIN